MEFLVTGVVYGAIFLVGVWLCKKCSYTYDRNPYRRWCDDCGQEQHRYQSGHVDMCHVGGGAGWWETNGPIPNPKCKCHKDTR